MNKQNKDNFVADKTLKQHLGNIEQDYIFVTFSALWCSPCKQLALSIEEIKDKYTEAVEFKKIDIDVDSEIAHYSDIKSIPTVMILDKNFQIKERFSGFREPKELSAMLSGIIKNK